MSMAAASVSSWRRSLECVPVTFTTLEYTVKTKRKESLSILKGISGHFKPSRLTALMGPSGSGKTTLMDILAGRKTGAGMLSGEILYGGKGVGRAAQQSLSGYVEQFDTLLGELAVEQTLMYTAELKLPRSVSKSEKRQRCKEVIERLRLEKCRNTVIGNQLLRGISGGQAKRVNIALALITRPKVVFLDEPTSGLDSKMANEVCLLMQKLSADGVTVIATIHSPTSYAFSLFDDLFMLQAGGRVIYDGAVADVRAYFEHVGHPFPAEQGYSLPDWLVDTSSGHSEDGIQVVEAEAKEADFARIWEDKRGAQRGEEHKAAIAALRFAPSDVKSSPNSGPGQLHALRTLLAYRMPAHYRSVEFLGPRVGDKIFMSVLAMSLYWGIGDKTDAQSIQSTAAVLYFFCTRCGYGAAAFVPSLTLERPLFYRERADGCYSALTYYMSKFIEEALLCTATSFLFSVTVFFAINLQGNFFVFALIYFLTSMVSIVLAYAVAAVAPAMDAANALLANYVTTCMYFGGLFILFDQIPVGWEWYSWTSFLRYSWAGLMINQFYDQPPGVSRVFFDDSTSVNINVLQFYGMDDGLMSSLWACVGLLTAILVCFGVLGALLLTFVSHMKR